MPIGHAGPAATVSTNAAAPAARMIARAGRCTATRVDSASLGFIATRAAMGIQSASGTCNPKAIATVIATATARITAEKDQRPSPLDRRGAAGISAVGSGCAVRPAASHTVAA